MIIKTYLSFNDQSEEDMEKFKLMMKATDMSLALWEIAQDVLRPHRKHGYSDNNRLNELLQSEQHGESVNEAIGLIEDMFYKVLNERSIDLD